MYLREVNGKTIKVLTYPTQSLSGLKAELTSKLRIPATELSFIFKGAELGSDSDLLLQHHILNNSIVHVLRQAASEEINVNFINTLTKEWILLSLKSTESIGEVKRRLAEQINVPQDKLLLVYCGG